MSAELTQWACVAFALVWLIMSARFKIEGTPALTSCSVFVAAAFVIGALS